MDLRYKSYILRPEENPNSFFNDYRREHWSRARSQEEGGNFNLWEKGGRFPTHSLPALEAAKCVEEQGKPIFEKYHHLLLKAFFDDNRDISDFAVLTALAVEAGADVPIFREAMKSGRARRMVFAEHQEAAEKYLIHAVPTVIIGGREQLVGAVPRQAYREVIEKVIRS